MDVIFDNCEIRKYVDEINFENEKVQDNFDGCPLFVNDISLLLISLN
jgi:hypothetical protein